MRASPRFLALVALAGCITPPKPPPTQTYALGISRATYRKYAGAKVGICEAEPRWLLDELSSVNGLLARFLESTRAGPEREWTEQELALLEEATRTLPAVLEDHQANLELMARCGFAEQRAFPELRKRGLEYVADARERLSGADDIVAGVRAREALARWKEERPEQQSLARKGCPDRPSAQLYFAYQDEKGDRYWLFCDGAKVSQPAGGEREVELPVGLSPRQLKKLRPKTYLDAAKRHPEAEMSRAPRPAEQSAGGR